MTDKFTDALLAALNESGEVKESDWRSIEAVLRGPLEQVPAAPRARVEPVDQGGPVDSVDPVEGAAPADAAASGPAAPRIAENRFAAMISSGMAKIRTESN